MEDFVFTLGMLLYSSYLLFKWRVNFRSVAPGVSFWGSAAPGLAPTGDAGMTSGASFSAITDFRGGTISALQFSTRVLGSHSSNRLLSARF